MSTSRTYHHGDLAAALVDVALVLLAEGGPDALSLRAVARRAGVSPMAPYRHYADKAALLAAVAARGFEGLRVVLQAADDTGALHPPSGAPPANPLIAQSVAYVRYALANPALFRLMFGPAGTAHHPKLRDSGKTAYDVLADRVAAQTPVCHDREARVLGCWSLVHGLSMLLLDNRTAPGLAADPETLTRRVAAAMLMATAPE